MKAKTRPLVTIFLMPGKKKKKTTTVLNVGMLTQVVCNMSESQMLSPDTLPMEAGPE